MKLHIKAMSHWCNRGFTLWCMVQWRREGGSIEKLLQAASMVTAGNE